MDGLKRTTLNGLHLGNLEKSYRASSWSLVRSPREKPLRGPLVSLGEPPFKRTPRRNKLNLNRYNELANLFWRLRMRSAT